MLHVMSKYGDSPASRRLLTKAASVLVISCGLFLCVPISPAEAACSDYTYIQVARSPYNPSKGIRATTKIVNRTLSCASGYTDTVARKVGVISGDDYWLGWNEHLEGSEKSWWIKLRGWYLGNLRCNPGLFQIPDSDVTSYYKFEIVRSAVSNHWAYEVNDVSYGQCQTDSTNGFDWVFTQKVGSSTGMYSDTNTLKFYDGQDQQWKAWAGNACGGDTDPDFKYINVSADSFLTDAGTGPCP